MLYNIDTWPYTTASRWRLITMNGPAWNKVKRVTWLGKEKKTGKFQLKNVSLKRFKQFRVIIKEARAILAWTLQTIQQIEKINPFCFALEKHLHAFTDELLKVTRNYSRKPKYFEKNRKSWTWCVGLMKSSMKHRSMFDHSFAITTCCWKK